MSTSEEHYPVKVGALGGRYVVAKLGKMRKARDWLVQPTDDDRIIVQGDGAIGCFTFDGRGILNTRGGYFVHLHPAAGARPFVFPPEFVRTCLDVAHPLDSETDTGRGVIVANTVRVIGGKA